MKQRIDVSMRVGKPKCWQVVSTLVLALCVVQERVAAEQVDRVKIFVVSSYHREYLWSRETQKGLCAGLLRAGYLDSQEQADEFTKHDYVESSRAIIRKDWMDTKRKYKNSEIAQSTDRITRVIKEFRPDVVFLGDDNAANYIGNQFLDTEIPVVFWGVNGWPVKYGLIDSIDNPGHNVTGVWQSGYYKESLELLHQLAPQAKTFAILACASETAIAKSKEISSLDVDDKLPLKLVDVVRTNSYPEFKRRALELAAQVDAFFVLNHDTLKDENNNHVDMLTVGRWYLEHIRKPETSDERQFVDEGMLCSADDSGFNQAFEAVALAVEILQRGVSPRQLPPRTPQRGPLIVNRQRAEMLGISLEPRMGMIEEVVKSALALQNAQENGP